MPNHVHALVRPVQGYLLKEILPSWKSFSAHKLNEALGRKGTFWQDESFDCIVRNPAQLEKYSAYIQANPAKAGLKAGEYRLNVGQASRLARPDETSGNPADVKPGQSERKGAGGTPALLYFLHRVGAEAATRLQVGTPGSHPGEVD